MIDRISFSILMLISMVASSLSTYGQEIDRSILSSAYHTSDLKGEWVLGETIVADYQGVSHELNSGFLTGTMKVISTSVEKELDYSLAAFPNPFSDQIHIQHNFPQAVIINITDMQGRSLLKQRLIINQSTLFVSHLPAGLYFMNYYTNSLDRGIYLILKMK